MSGLMTRSLLLVLPLFTATAAMCAEMTFATLADDDRNLVMFESNAPLEKVVGRTSEVAGTVTLNPEDLSAAISGELVAELSTMDTGLQLRNQHMRENHLNTAEYPTATFEVTGIDARSAASLPVGEPLPLAVTGNLSLRGITKEYTADAVLTFTLTGDKPALIGEAHFEVTLEDHEIPRPKYLFMKLAEVQEVSVRFYMVAE